MDYGRTPKHCESLTRMANSKGMRIDVFESETSAAVLPLLWTFSSTAQLNIMTADSCCVAYPTSTFRLHSITYDRKKRGVPINGALVSSTLRVMGIAVEEISNQSLARRVAILRELSEHRWFFDDGCAFMVFGSADQSDLGGVDSPWSYPWWNWGNCYGTLE